ncbi:AtpZ/AtpI family protein [Flavobacteriales bacterium]|nr:AtpZ/AtpI family protein [Flavobacteriales bacterium]
MKKSKPNNPYRYYFIGTQVAATIGASVFLGYQIDKFLKNTYYMFTIIISLCVILYALWSLVKDVNKEK